MKKYIFTIERSSIGTLAIDAEGCTEQEAMGRVTKLLTESDGLEDIPGIVLDSEDEYEISLAKQCEEDEEG